MGDSGLTAMLKCLLPNTNTSTKGEIISDLHYFPGTHRKTRQTLSALEPPIPINPERAQCQAAP